MAAFDLDIFKTQPCTVHTSVSGWMLFCPYFHTQLDKRRSPATHQYHPIYLYREPSLCLNMVEFLFHPMMYKTKLCCEGGCQFRLKKHEMAYCPFYHYGEGEERKKLRDGDVGKIENIKLMVEKEIQMPRSPVEQKGKVQEKALQSVIKEEVSEMQDSTRQQIKPVEQKEPAIEKVQRIESYQMKNGSGSYDNENESEKRKKKRSKKLKQNNFRQVYVERSQPERKPEAPKKQPIKKEQPKFIPRKGEKLAIRPSQTLEFLNFKNEYQTVVQRLAETVCAMANTKGGIIWGGVASDGQIVGVDFNNKTCDSFLLSIDNEFRDFMNPSLSKSFLSLKFVKIEGMANNMSLVQFIIQPAYPDTFFTYKDNYFIREGSQTCRTTRAELFKHLEQPLQQQIRDGLKRQDLDRKQLSALKDKLFKLDKT